MRNYTTKEAILKDELVNFCTNITKGLNKVETHFMVDMITGIFKVNSIVLSEIVRGFYENPNIKKSVERIERHLDNYPNIANIIEKNYTEYAKSLLDNRRLYFVDGSDIIKGENTKFENMGFTLDGSDCHKVKNGYKIQEITSVDNAGQPVTLFSEIKSSKEIENRYKSENEMWSEHMNYVAKTYGKGTFICDRGFDSSILMQKIMETDNDFIIRCKSLNRIVRVNFEDKSISKIAKKVKGYYKFTSILNGKKIDLKVTSKEIIINNKDEYLKSKSLYLVIVKGYAIDLKTNNEAYMALLTSKKCITKEDTIAVVKSYISRWKIEENFRFNKQQYGIENIRTRKYNRIQALYKILKIALIFTNLINIHAIGKVIRKEKKQIKKYIKFWLYRISDGIKLILKIFSHELMIKMYPLRERRTRNLFTVSGVRVYC